MVRKTFMQYARSTPISQIFDLKSTRAGADGTKVAPGFLSRYRVYDLDLPLRIPGFGVGFAISKFKQIGVWSKLPPALRAKAKDARGTWSGMKLTQRISIRFRTMSGKSSPRILRWRYAAKPVERGAEPVAALG